MPELMIPVMNEKLRKGMELKFLIPINLLPDKQPAQNVELRGLPFIPAIIVLTEKDAEICFRFIEGRVDYAGFYGNDDVFRGWIKDLLLYYWDKGRHHSTSKMD